MTRATEQEIAAGAQALRDTLRISWDENLKAGHIREENIIACATAVLAAAQSAPQGWRPIARPDFGEHEVYHDGAKITCGYVAPGLTFSNLMKIFDQAEAQAEPGDRFSSHPSKWPNHRGVYAVTEAILNAIFLPPPPVAPAVTQGEKT